MNANDRLYDELLRPIVDDFYEGCQDLANLKESADPTVRVALLAKLSLLEEVGTRTARVLEVAEPLWDDMRGLAGLPW